MKPLVTDALWERIQPLLPPHPPRRHRFPGRKPLDDRMVLTGILFVLKTGIAWDDLPAELGCGCIKPADNTNNSGTNQSLVETARSPWPNSRC
jgi:transposase